MHRRGFHKDSRRSPIDGFAGVGLAMAIAATVAAFAVAGMPSEKAVARAFTLLAAPQVDPVVTTATQAAGL